MLPIDPETQKYFDDYLDLFGHPGWKRFMEDLSESLVNDQKTAVQRCDTTEKWFEERGLQAKTMKLLTFETLIRNKYEQLVAEALEDDTDED